jgi:FKBP-type peptidyl-prolyl cis-trans isomerase FkpA
MFSLTRLSSLVLGTAMVLSACSGEKPKTDDAAPAPAGVSATTGPADPATTTFAPALDIDLSTYTHTANGLYYKDLVVGTGARADSGKTVSVHYTGYLADGTMFETSTKGEPYTFPLGRGGVVQGWDQGIPGMMVGGKRQLVIPSSLGYGDMGQGPIPGGAIMVFTVELMGVK